MFSRSQPAAPPAVSTTASTTTASTWSQWTTKGGGDPPRSPLSTGSSLQGNSPPKKFGEVVLSPSDRQRTFSNTSQLRLSVSQTLDSQASSPTPAQCKISREAAEHEEMLDSLEVAHQQVQADQWSLLRRQIQSLVGALSETRAELADTRAELGDMKTKVYSRDELDDILERMATGHDEHAKNDNILAERVTFLETLFDDSAAKHDTQLTEITSMHETRVNLHRTEMGQQLGELAERIAENRATMESNKQRVVYLETVIGESAEKHAKELAEHKEDLKIHKEILAGHKEHNIGHKETMETRLEYLESIVGDSAEKHAEAEGHRSSLANTLDDFHGKHGGLEQRVADLETREAKLLILENGLKSFTELMEDYKSDFDLHKGAFESHRGEIATRFSELLEKHQTMSESTTSIEMHVSENEALRAKLNDISGRVSTNEALLARFKDAFGDRIDVTEKKTTDGTKKLSVLEVDCEKLKSTNEQLHNVLRTIQSEHELGSGSIQQRLTQFEQALSEVSDKLAREVENNQGKIRDNTSKLDAQKLMYESYKSSVEPRLRDLESAVSEGAQSAMLMKELNMGIDLMQADQKKSREVLESFFDEQLRFQVGQERSAREATELTLQTRLEECDSEVVRLWQALEHQPTETCRPPSRSASQSVLLKQVTVAAPPVQSVRMATPTRRMMRLVSVGSMRAPNGNQSVPVPVPAAIMPGQSTFTNVCSASPVPSESWRPLIRELAPDRLREQARTVPQGLGSAEGVLSSTIQPVVQIEKTRSMTTTSSIV